MSLKEQFYNLLQATNGNADAVADTIADCLNEAVKEYESKSKSIQKKKDADALANKFNEFAETYYPDLGVNNMTGDEIINIWSAAGEIFTGIKDVSEGKKSLEDMIAEMGW